jgi:hypothetical protein
MELQIEALSQENQLLEDAGKTIVAASEARRQALNQLFRSALDCDDPTALLAAWQQTAGYPAEYIEEN